MAKRGRAKPALATAAIGSFVAGTIGLILLTFLAQPIADLAVKLQPADYFALVVLAFVAVTSLIGRSLDPRAAVARARPRDRADRDRPAHRPGAAHLRRRPAVRRRRHRDRRRRPVRDRRGAPHGLAHRAARRGARPPSPARPGSAARTCAAPGGRGCAGPRSASRSARCRPAAPRSRRSCPTRRSAGSRKGKAKEEFGEGAIEGVAGPEAANNAAFTGVLVPLLTIGIPTSATAAILIAAFQIFDLQPGPQLFENEPDLVWALIASLYVGNVMLLVLNLPLIRLWVKVLEIPRPCSTRRSSCSPRSACTRSRARSPRC